MIYIVILLCTIIIILLIYIFLQQRHIQTIINQINHILFQQQDFYSQHFKEGKLSLLENQIMKLVNRLSEQNYLLQEDKLLMKQSLEDISHQMKTPLTSLNIINERLKYEPTKQLIKEQERLLQKVEWLVASLLKIAQLDANVVTFQSENITHQQFINQLIDVFNIQLELKNIHVDCHVDDDYFYFDVLWTIEALSNIFKNCIEHTPQDGSITISTKHTPLYDEIMIQDNGEGIDYEDLPHLFERFYKGKNSSENSVGIGLALSQMIIEKQQGTIMVENTYPGARFTIHFYREVV